MSERANPFNLDDFTPAPAKPKTEHLDVVDQVAAEHGFPSRQPPKPPAVPVVEKGPRKQRRYTTGRNKQINIKATDETIERMGQMADERGVPLGRLLELALDALAKTTK